MKHLLALLLPLLVLIAGCADTFTITRGSHYSDFEDANLGCLATTNHIRLRNGTVITTQELALARDSATWILPDGTRQKVRLWDIARIDNTNHRHGARSGAFVGLITGLGAGIAVSSQIHTDNTLSRIALTALSVVPGALGGIVGTAVGTAIGYHTIIRFDSAAAVPADTMRPQIHSSAGWAMPETSDSTKKP